MDIYLNMRAFQTTAETGNFSRAARELGVAASVVTKRVNQLEHQLGVTLFRRSTRAVVLTEPGRRYLEKVRGLTAQIDELLSSTRQPKALEDFIRIKAPTSMTVLYLNRIFQAFAADFPRVRLELVLVDRPIDPVSEGFDIAIGAFPLSFGHAMDEPLCRLERMLCASPAYLEARGVPRHPRDLVKHDCLSFVPTGNSWVFESERGPITIEVTPRISSNDGQILVDAAVNGNGVAVVSKYAARKALHNGDLVRVLPDFPLPDMWIKAVAPEWRVNAPAIRMLVDYLRAALTPVPPWDSADEPEDIQ
ncbi:MAG: LysR family transcriptional regulator [Ectothiorhodospiraceae bacterium]|nr:LysR family transcriptional regulator [Ectothiorhodospiraceae bacterium]